jgi:hypothetical protein
MGRLWTYVRDERPYGGARAPAAVFFASPDRKGERPLAHLAGFAGVLQADGYAGFNGLYDTGRIVEAACWAHTRRKFFDVHAATAPGSHMRPCSGSARSTMSSGRSTASRPMNGDDSDKRDPGPSPTR